MTKKYDGTTKRVTPKRATPKLHGQPHPTRPGFFWCSQHRKWERN